MEIPENWQEELMLHDWKMMRIERCKAAAHPGYIFPNGIHLQNNRIRVDAERAKSVLAALSEWETKMKVKKGVADIELKWDYYKTVTQGDLDDLKWLLYALFE